MLTHIPIPDDITAVVLDLDGTIYRKPKMALYMLLKQWCHLPSLIAERRWRKAQRKALREGKLMPSMPVSEQWYRQNYLPSMVDIIAKHYQPQPWLQPLISECKRRHIQLIILSDYEAATAKLQALGIDPKLFDLILSTGDFSTIKPDPQLGEIIAGYLLSGQSDATHKKNNAAIIWQHVLFIGDREDTDGMLAHALGAQFTLA